MLYMRMHFDDNLIRLAVDKYSDIILRVAVNHVQNISDAEDVLQEVFLALLKARPQLEDEQHLKAWLLRVAVNKCRDLHRIKRRTVSIESAKRKYGFNDDDVGLLEQIRKLKPLDRDIVYLHYIEGYSAKETALILDKNENAIYTRLKRIRAKLKNLLDEEAR